MSSYQRKSPLQLISHAGSFDSATLPTVCVLYFCLRVLPNTRNILQEALRSSVKSSGSGNWTFPFDPEPTTCCLLMGSQSLCCNLKTGSYLTKYSQNIPLHHPEFTDTFAFSTNRCAAPHRQLKDPRITTGNAAPDRPFWTGRGSDDPRRLPTAECSWRGIIGTPLSWQPCSGNKIACGGGGGGGISISKPQSLVRRLHSGRSQQEVEK